MFASRFAFSGQPARSASASSYRDLELESSVMHADAHRLIEMLYDEAATRLAQARAALRDGRIAAKGEATGRTVRILEEGLKASLDARGGELAGNLRLLYDYMMQRLLRANAANDDEAYAEVAGLLDSLRQTWKEIGPQARGARADASGSPAAGMSGMRPGTTGYSLPATASVPA